MFENSKPSVVGITVVKAGDETFKGIKLSKYSERENLYQATSSMKPGDVGSGSGFVWDKEGHIVTNFHVVGSADILLVSFHGETIPHMAKVVGTVPTMDIAVIKLLKTPKKGLLPSQIGRSKDLVVGQKTLAVGSPFRLNHTITRGIVLPWDEMFHRVGIRD